MTQAHEEGESTYDLGGDSSAEDLAALERMIAAQASAAPPVTPEEEAQLAALLERELASTEPVSPEETARLAALLEQELNRDS